MTVRFAVFVAVLFACASAFTASNSSWAQGPAADTPSAASANEPVKLLKVDFSSNRGDRNEVGEVIVEAQDGGLLFQTTDGHQWLLDPKDIRSKTEPTESFTPLGQDEIYKKVRSELPPGFLVHKTAHYVLIYNTSETYVRWVGDLLERLHRGYYAFWKSKKVKLEEPRFPLVGLVFDTKEAYLAYAERELGESAKSVIGYYQMETNRVVTFDLTGVEGLTTPGQKVATAQLLNTIFSQPQAERTVSTIVHEAFHQLAFNSGLQVRLADNPLWVSEGLAMYFETPDVSNSKGWAKIGQPNVHQMRMFSQYLGRRPADSLTTLIADSSRFQKIESVQDAYAESWALTYFLMKDQPAAFAEYMKEIGKLAPLGESTSRERVELFQKHFGDLEKLDQRFVKTIRRMMQ